MRLMATYHELLKGKITSRATRRLKELEYQFVTLDIKGYKIESFDDKLRGR
ncbi:hypothetical protein ACFLT8_02870 [Chloroflexota bacterium]